MKQFTFFAVYMLLFGSLLGVSSAYGQTLMNGSADFTVGDDALISVHGVTKNAGTVNVQPKGMVNLHGNLDLQGTSIFWLKSRSYTETASLIGYGTVTTTSGDGKLVSERYITSADNSDAKWHYFTAPVSGQDIDGDWMKDNHIAYYDGGAGADKADFWRWNEPTSKWIHFSDASFQDGGQHEKFKSGYGYITAVKQDGRAAQGTLEFEGNTFKSSSAEGIGVSTGGVENPPYYCWRGWNLIGNPYPSAYNIKKWLDRFQNSFDACHQAVYLYVESTPGTFTGQTEESVDNDFQFCRVQDYKVISNNGSGIDYDYYYIPNGGNINDPEHIGGTFGELSDNDYIAPGQAFFVKTLPHLITIGFPIGDAASTDIDPVLNIDGLKDSENYRAHAFDNATYRDEEQAWPSFALLVNDEEGHATSSVVSFHEKMTHGLDPSCDVVRLKNEDQAVAVYTQMVEADNACGGLKMQALPLLESDTERGGVDEETVTPGYIIPVGLDVKNTMNANFNAVQDQLEGKSIILEDRKLNEFTDLTESNYATTVEKSENGFGRFYIHFGPKADEEMISANNLQISAYMIDKHQLKVLNPAHIVGDYKIFDMNGSILYDGHLNGNGEQIIHVDLPLAMYVLNVNTTLKSQSFKFINK